MPRLGNGGNGGTGEVMLVVDLGKQSRVRGGEVVEHKVIGKG